MLSTERLCRCEKYLDVPDRDGSKPFVFSIDGKDLQASNRKGANWDCILTRTKKYGFKGDFSQQFAAFKKWLESDRRIYAWSGGDKKEKEVIKGRKAFKFD